MRSVIRVCFRSIRRPLRNKHAFVIVIGAIVAVYVILATDVISGVGSFKHPGFVFRFEASDQQQIQDISLTKETGQSGTMHHLHLHHPSPIFHHHSGNSTNTTQGSGQGSVFVWLGNNTGSNGGTRMVNSTARIRPKNVDGSNMDVADNNRPEVSKGNHSSPVLGLQPLGTQSGEEVDNSEEKMAEESIFASTSSILLAGVPKPQIVFLTMGMVTVKRDKADYFFSTMDSLFKSSSPDEQREVTIVVMLADRSASYNRYVLRKIKNRFRTHLQSGLLLVVRGPNTDFIFNNTDIKRTFDDSLMRVQWRSKQNVDYAALMEFCANLSTYYLHLEDDVIAVDNYLRLIRDFIKTNDQKLWAMLEVSPHGFIGKLFKNQDLPKLVTILRSFYLEQPCDFLINYFTQLMTQSKRIVRSGNLFLHQGKFSTLVNQTRKTDKLDGSEPDKVNSQVDKSPRKELNPAAVVSSNLTVYQTHSESNAYNLQTSDFMWALDVQEGQRLTVAFSSTETLGRVVVNTGFSDQNQKDSLQNGRLEMGTKEPSPSTPLLCPEARTVGQFKNGRIDVTLKPPHDIKCLSVVISAPQNDWLIIREIIVTPP